MRRAGLALAAAVLVVAAGCTKEGPEPPPPTRRQDVRSADELARALCRRPAPPAVDAGDATTELPPAVAQVVDQIQDVRGLEFLEPVRAEAVTHEELVERLDKYLDYSFPPEILDPRTLAWRAIGVIPPDADLHEALLSFYGGQVIGFYDPASTELVYIGTEDPTPLERVTLAHELVHALDDQHFDLERLNLLEAECRDEELVAAVGLAEGSAQFFANRWSVEYLTAREQSEVGLGGGGSLPSGVPEFVLTRQFWPYLEGHSFVTAMVAEGGTEAVDAAFRELPESTEQIIHTEKYPSDDPTAVGVPDLGSALGAGWTDLDVMTVGEEWLAAALDLRLDGSTSSVAAEGWDGGRYRAWSDGDDVAVVLQTVWDSAADAEEFAAAMEAWLAEADAGPDVRAEVLPTEGGVAVLWAPDDATLEALRSGLAGIAAGPEG